MLRWRALATAHVLLSRLPRRPTALRGAHRLLWGGVQQIRICRLLSSTGSGDVDLTSAKNPLVKHLARLRSSRRYRQRSGSFVVRGASVVADCLTAGASPVSVLCGRGLLHDDGLAAGVELHYRLRELRDDGVAVTASPPVLRAAAGVEAVDDFGIVAEFSLPPSRDVASAVHVAASAPLLALDGVADPGNVGTLLRTAHVLGWGGAVLLPGTADAFNDKAVAASRGAVTALPLWRASWSDAVAVVRAAGGRALVADAGGGDAPVAGAAGGITPAGGGGVPDAPGSGGLAMLVLCSETHGPSAEARAAMREHSQTWNAVHLPVAGSVVASLNVAVAGGILMYVLQQPRL